MILPVALPFVVVKNRIIEPVDSGIYLKFLIIFQMGIENKSDIRSNAISFMYNAFPIQGTKIASTTSDRIDIGKYFPFFCLKSKITCSLQLDIVTDKQGNTLEITFRLRNYDPVMTKFDPDRLYQLEQNLKKVLKLNPSKADSSIRNMKYIQPIDYKDLK